MPCIASGSQFPQPIFNALFYRPEASILKFLVLFLSVSVLGYRDKVNVCQLISAHYVDECVDVGIGLP
jgi:hypothetical protein